MYVIKRDGRREDVMFDKITSRINRLCYNLNMDFIDPASITLKVINGLYPGVNTSELDNLAAETSASMTTKHPDYTILAARIAVSNLHKSTKEKFTEVINDLFRMKTKNIDTPMISKQHYKIIMEHGDLLNSCINYDRDYTYNYFGFKVCTLLLGKMTHLSRDLFQTLVFNYFVLFFQTLERSYLMKINNKVVERPQHMLMRVAVGIHGDDIKNVIETYNLLSEKWFTHASPTLFNAATPIPQLSR